MGREPKIVRRGTVSEQRDGKAYESTYEILGSRDPLVRVSLVGAGSKATQVGGMDEESLAHMRLSELIGEIKRRSTPHAKAGPMPEPRCPNPKCAAGTFQLKEALVERTSTLIPDAGPAKMTLVQCAHCGTVVGVLPRLDLDHYVEKIAEKLGVF